MGLSFIYIQKLKCITKEAVEEKFKDKVFSDDREDLTVGDDLDSLKMRILARQLTKNSLKEYGEKKQTFQLSLLTNDERRKLERKDSLFLRQFYIPNPDVPEAIMKTSESNLKYLESECWRDTFFIVEGEVQEDFEKWLAGLNQNDETIKLIKETNKKKNFCVMM